MDTFLGVPGTGFNMKRRKTAEGKEDGAEGCENTRRCRCKGVNKDWTNLYMPVIRRRYQTYV
jgi:hypothetical protein